MSSSSHPNIQYQTPTTDSGLLSSDADQISSSPDATQSSLCTGENSDSEANITTVPNSPISTAKNKKYQVDYPKQNRSGKKS